MRYSILKCPLNTLFRTGFYFRMNFKSVEGSARDDLLVYHLYALSI